MTTLLPRPFPPLDVDAGPAIAEPVAVGRPLRWGIVATGNIAHSFAGALALLDDHEVAAVGSRRRASAEAFAQRFGGTPYDDYAAVASDPDVDVVYVATPHALHKENTLLALDLGKPVLCEKAFALNASEAEEMVAAARERGLFLMEAMWMRCIPTIRRLQQLAQTGELGAVRQVKADLGFPVDRPADDRLLDPALGGGALLDMGIYPLTFASLVLGGADRVAATATLSESGIDLDISLSLGYPGGGLASLTSSMTSQSPRTASVATERGRFDLPSPFHHPPSISWTSGHGEHAGSDEVREQIIGTGLAHEAMEAARCLRAGEVESPLVPLEDTLALTRLMDRIRGEIGVRYAADVPTGAQMEG